MEIQKLYSQGGKPWYDFNNFIEDLIIKQACSKDKTSIDVGCFSGRFAWWMAKNSKITYSFDPSPRLLLKNLSKWSDLPWVLPENVDNMVFINCALGERQDILNYIEFNEPSWNSLMPDTTKRRVELIKKSEKRVVVLKLDDTLQLNDLALLKVDAEGFDLSVLRGAKQTIQRNKPVIIIEAPNVSDRRRVAEFLTPFGYEIFSAGWAIEDQPFNVNVPALNLFCIHSSDTVRKQQIIQHHNMLINLYELMDSYDYDVAWKWMNNFFNQ